MDIKLIRSLGLLVRDDRGVTLIEYGIGVLLALVVGGSLMLNGVGAAVNTQLGEAGGCITAKGAPASC